MLSLSVRGAAAIIPKEKCPHSSPTAKAAPLRTPVTVIPAAAVEAAAVDLVGPAIINGIKPINRMNNLKAAASGRLMLYYQSGLIKQILEEIL
jgi:hypothetical protein